MDRAQLQSLMVEPVGVLGAGVSGLAVAGVLERLGVSYVLYDEKAKRLDIDNVRKHKLIIYSPGFEQSHPWIKLAKEQKSVCLGELDFGALMWEGTLYAITGTNGKTTLTTLLAQALSENNIKAVAVGNVGVPLSSLCVKSIDTSVIAVCEVSSFQLEESKYFKPSVVLWTNFAEDHLNRHGSMGEYFRLKYRLIDNIKGDVLILGRSVSDFADKVGIKLPKFAEIIDNYEIPTPQKGQLCVYPHSENYKFAYRLWEKLRLPTDNLVAFAEKYQLPEYRLQFFREINGIAFWNDSKATNLDAAQAALKSFNKKVCWIGGGYDKGGSADDFINDVYLYIKNALVVGDTAQILKEKLDSKGVNTLIKHSIDSAVEEAARICVEGDVVLFSPGYSSFDLYENYIHRGKCYEKAVLGLKNQIKHSIT